MIKTLLRRLKNIGMVFEKLYQVLRDRGTIGQELTSAAETREF